jgi:hypothetical protein
VLWKSLSETIVGKMLASGILGFLGTIVNLNPVAPWTAFYTPRTTVEAGEKAGLRIK